MRLAHGDGWDGDASEPGGPLGWAPLLYVCHSVFASPALARELLARGADPNVTFTNEYGEMSALYGAAGVVHNPELTRVLLEAGANPDDGESVYHSTEAASPECLRALLDYGATVEPIMLAHALDDERPEHVRLLLDAGADATELLPFAVRRGRGPEYLKQLVDFGAELEHRSGEGWRHPTRLRTAYQHAVLRGSGRLGGAAGRTRRGDPGRRGRPRDRRGRARRATRSGARDARLRPAGGRDPRRPARPDGAGRSSSSAPTSAASSAARRRARCSSTSAGWAIPRSRSSCSLRAPRSDGALDWAVHGSQHHAIEGRDYVGVASRLVAAGAVIEPAHLEQADGPLAEWLQARRPR